jgi:hypothetical protein
VIVWSDPSPPFAIPAGAVDIYQSIQRLEPGAWVAAHTHDGPESGVVLDGTLARHEGGVTRSFAAGATFCTPGGVVHATGNPAPQIAQAITLHVVRAGSPFSTPCACASAPPPQPGSSNPARSVARGVSVAARSARARHARVTVTGPLALVPDDGFPIVLTVLAGCIAGAGLLLDAAAFAVFTAAANVQPADGPADVLVTRFERMAVQEGF